MSNLEYSEKTLYDLLFILCDMLSSEDIAYHEEILCDFIKTIELEGKPLKPFIKITTKYKHLRSTLENTFRNISYASKKKILGVMQEVWPDDIEIINRLERAAYMLSLDTKNQASKVSYLSGKALIQNLLADS